MLPDVLKGCGLAGLVAGAAWQWGAVGLMAACGVVVVVGWMASVVRRAGQ